MWKSFADFLRQLRGEHRIATCLSECRLFRCPFLRPPNREPLRASAVSASLDITLLDRGLFLTNGDNTVCKTVFSGSRPVVSSVTKGLGGAETGCRNRTAEKHMPQRPETTSQPRTVRRSVLADQETRSESFMASPGKMPVLKYAETTKGAEKGTGAERGVKGGGIFLFPPCDGLIVARAGIRSRVTLPTPLPQRLVPLS